MIFQKYISPLALHQFLDPYKAFYYIELLKQIFCCMFTCV